MNWLSWCLGGLLLLAVWLLVMFLAAFSFNSDPPFAAICTFFEALTVAWLTFGIFGAFGVSLSVSLEAP